MKHLPARPKDEPVQKGSANAFAEKYRTTLAARARTKALSEHKVKASIGAHEKRSNLNQSEYK